MLFTLLSNDFILILCFKEMIERGDDSSDDSDEDDNDDEDDDDSSSDEEEVKVAPPPKVCLQFKSPFIKGKKT